MDLETIFQGEMTRHKWNLLGDYLKGQKIQTGTGLTMTSSDASGITFSAIKERSRRPSAPPPFSPLTVSKIPESADYKVTLQEGLVIVRETRDGTDAMVYHFPKIGADLMSAEPRPEITVSDGDFILAQYDTDEEGFIIGDVSIIAGAESDSDHHQPPSGESIGSGGYYFVKLLEFIIDDGAPTFKLHQQSDIEHSRLPTFQNVGGARNVHKEWNGPDDRYDFRTLKQFEPEGRTYGKVIVDLDGDEGDDVNDDIKFSAIAERASDPQINVNDDGAGTVTIEGNGNDGSLVWENCDSSESDTTLLSWTDGLVTTAGEASFKAGCGLLPTGYAGDILYHNGTAWVVLSNPGAPFNTDAFQVLVHDGTGPSWYETEL